MNERLPDTVPSLLRTERVVEAAASVKAALDASQIERDAGQIDDRLERVFALSPYVMEQCRRRPELIARLVIERAFRQPGQSTAELIDELQDGLSSALPIGSADSGEPGPAGDSGQPPGDTDSHASDERYEQLTEVPEAAALAGFRVFRHRHMVRILWRELEQIATLDETLTDLTRLAEASIAVATRLSETIESRRWGVPRDADGRVQRLIVLGMGKLGGGELNVSSDVDLIALWPSPGKTDGRRGQDNSEFFARVVRRMTKLLASVTVDGFAFRVDTRLRPFGESGPLAMHLDAFEHYLLTQGRDWERYAMIKARALTGDAEDIVSLQSLLTPFVYRRYIDYDALVSLASLKSKIRQSLATRRDGPGAERQDDIKLGSGGIREVEFTGQAVQLMRGGRHPELQQRPIRKVLRTLADRDLMDLAEVDALLSAYAYLRRVENALQLMRDEQTHVLPQDPLELTRLVTILNEPDLEHFRQKLDAHRQRVSESFAGVLGDVAVSVVDGPGSDDAAGAGERSLDVSAMSPEEAMSAALAWLEGFGIDADAALAERLLALAGGPFHRRLTARAQSRVEQLLPRLATAAGETAVPRVAMSRGLDFMRTVAGRSGYLQALADRPAALARVVRLFAVSEWVANLVTRHPIVVDELIGQSASTLFDDAETIRREAMEEAVRLADSDLERQMDAIRQFQHARELRIAAAALEGELPPMQASDRLSWLAEAMVAAVLELVRPPLHARYGESLPEIVVVAYGKLGGLELGFGSDLDLVVLRGGQGEGDAGARLVQKFTHFMSTATPAGRVYEIDLRLRPNGGSGLLVGTLDSFERYQHEDAWTWEHQALLRARAIFGPDHLRARFAEIRRAVLCLPRDKETLRNDVASMRERMRTALGTKSTTAPDGAETAQMNLKQDAGGIADIEFIVQYLALRHAADAPSLVGFTDNVRVLSEAGRLGLLADDDVAGLRQDYVELRERLHRRSLDLASASVPLDSSLSALCARVVERRRRLLGDAVPVGETNADANAVAGSDNRDPAAPPFDFHS